MGEIDDLYKQEVEDIDLKFVDEMEITKDREKSVEKYREKLRKSRAKFDKDYKKFNAREKKRISGTKKKIPGNGKFKHLVIAHFDFAFGFWERFRMRWNIRWFNFMRKVRRFNAWVFPSWFIYGWCKVRNFFKYLWRDFSEVVEITWEGMKKFAVKSGIWAWGILKLVWKGIVFLSGKLVFWRKKKDVEEEKEGEKEKEGEEKKEEEV